MPTRSEAVARLRELGVVLKEDCGGWADSGSDCLRKHQYASKADASTAKGRLANKGKRMNVYQCLYCHKWHLARLRDRLGRLLK